MRGDVDFLCFWSLVFLFLLYGFSSYCSIAVCLFLSFFGSSISLLLCSLAPFGFLLYRSLSLSLDNVAKTLLAYSVFLLSYLMNS